MEILQFDSERIRLSLSRGELVFVNNILNEVCNGFRVADFVAQVGISQQDVRELLAKVHDVAERAPDNGAGQAEGRQYRQNIASLDLGRGELMAIRNALRESLRELGIQEFDTRVGLSFEEGQAKLRELDSLVEGMVRH